MTVCREGNNNRLSPKLALLAVICFATCIEAVARPATTVKETRDNISRAILRTMGVPRFIVGLLVPVNMISGNLGTMGTGNARAGQVS
jgi:Na+/pantothenate symporter